ncbi:hypothetical protein GQ600_12801 [Phytophthora cactorum]|nr:hypothetical protein GQ600_12801 [Phytophthora cactorum]
MSFSMATALGTHPSTSAIASLVKSYLAFMLDVTMPELQDPQSQPYSRQARVKLRCSLHIPAWSGVRAPYCRCGNRKTPVVSWCSAPTSVNIIQCCQQAELRFNEATTTCTSSPAMPDKPSSLTATDSANAQMQLEKREVKRSIETWLLVRRATRARGASWLRSSVCSKVFPVAMAHGYSTS